jgi:hypothetical protein
VAVEAAPTSLRGFGELEYHGERRRGICALIEAMPEGLWRVSGLFQLNKLTEMEEQRGN